MWSKHLVRRGNKVSVVFSWDLWDIIQAGPELEPCLYGGPAVTANPTWIPDWMVTSVDEPFLSLHNPLAMRTSRGCLNRCPFCIVPVLEGDLQEIDDFDVKPVVIDNNLLACSRGHFDLVIDALKALDWCDFNQGLDVRLLNGYHANRMAELKNPIIRLSFDHTRLEANFLKSFQFLRKAGIAKNRIRAYVLIGYDDTPEDALYRLELIRSLGILSSPMRFQPLDVKVKNEYVAEAWTHKELIRFMSYWSNFRYTRHVPFKDYYPHKQILKKEKLLSYLI